MPINSKQKGKRGELELCQELKKYGYECRRSVQYNGKADEGNADVVGLPHIHAEIKRVEQLNLYNAMDQAKRDAKNDDYPTVFHRKNRCGWLVTLELDSFMELYKAYETKQRLLDYIAKRGNDNG